MPILESRFTLPGWNSQQHPKRRHGCTYISRSRFKLLRSSRRSASHAHPDSLCREFDAIRHIVSLCLMPSERVGHRIDTFSTSSIVDIHAKKRTTYCPFSENVENRNHACIHRIMCRNADIVVHRLYPMLTMHVFEKTSRKQ